MSWPKYAWPGSEQKGDPINEKNNNYTNILHVDYTLEFIKQFISKFILLISNQSYLLQV